MTRQSRSMLAGCSSSDMTKLQTLMRKRIDRIVSESNPVKIGFWFMAKRYWRILWRKISLS